MIPMPGGRMVTDDEIALLKEPGYLDVYRKDRIMSDAASGQDNDIGWAVKQMRGGAHVARRGWNGKNMWLKFSDPAGSRAVLPGVTGTFENLPWIGMKTADDKFVPWLCSQTDLLAMDWELVT